MSGCKNGARPRIFTRRLSREEAVALLGMRGDLRAQIILASNKRESVSHIAEQLYCHHHTVRTWIKRFNAKGLSGLKDRPRSGRPRIYGQSEREQVRVLAQSDPVDFDLPSQTWTLSALQRVLVESGAAPAIGRETIRRILHEAQP